MKARRLIWNLIPLLWLAFALRVWRLAAQSLWYDEGYSAYLGAHLSLHQALDLTVRDIVPPLYYLLLRVWLPFAGTSEYALRFPSVLFGVLAVALMARIALYLVAVSVAKPNKVSLSWAGWVSGAIGASAPVLIWLSQDARMYGPLLTWSLLATWGLLRALSNAMTRKSRRRGWALFVGAGLAALYTHTVAAFWLLGQVTFGLLVTWQQRHFRERVVEARTALGLMAVGYLPWVIVASVSYQTNAGYWPGYLPPPHLWRVAWETFVGGQHLPVAATGPAAVWFGVAAVLAWLLLLLKRPRVATYLFCYLVIPLLAMGIVLQRTPKLAPRYPTAMAPAIFITLGVGVALAIGLSRITCVVSLVALSGVILIGVYADANLFLEPRYGKDDWRAAAAYVRTHREPHEAIILISGHAFPVFAYYYGWEGWYALPDDVQLDINHVLHYPGVAPRLNEALNQASGAWLVLWQDEVVDPTGLVPAMLSDAGQEVPVPVFPGSTAGDPVGLRRFEFQAKASFPEEPPIQNAINRTLAPGLTILGYDLPAGRAPDRIKQPLPADVEISTRVFWQAEEPLPGAYAASLRLSDQLGHEWARQDSLLAGPYFTERWPLGTPVMGNYTATLPLGTPPGVYTPTLMIYRGDETYETLRLSALVITRPLSIPQPPALGLTLPGELAMEGTPGGSAALSLVGVGFDQKTVTPCQELSLSLAWRAEARATQAYRLRLSAGTDQMETPLAPDYPTHLWQPGDVWRTRHRLPVDCRALDGTWPVLAQLLDGGGRPVGDPLNLGEINVVAGRQYTVPPDLTAVLDVRLYESSADLEIESEAATLIGYWLDEEQLTPGENLRVTLYWRAGHETDQNYSVFVHLEGDRVWAQHDSWPVDGKKPTTTWAPEEVVADRHVVPIDRDVPPGPLRLMVGMYDPATMQNLKAVGPSGDQIVGGRIVLQPIDIYVP